MWVGSDSWGAKVYPVRDQEFAAEGAITILPYRNALKGKRFLLRFCDPKRLIGRIFTLNLSFIKNPFDQEARIKQELKLIIFSENKIF